MHKFLRRENKTKQKTSGMREFEQEECKSTVGVSVGFERSHHKAPVNNILEEYTYCGQESYTLV